MSSIINDEIRCCEVCNNNIKKGEPLFAGGEYEDYCLCESCWNRPQCLSCCNGCYLVDGVCPYCGEDEEDDEPEDDEDDEIFNKDWVPFQTKLNKL